LNKSINGLSTLPARTDEAELYIVWSVCAFVHVYVPQLILWLHAASRRK
jgi:hypothetical protein